MGQGKEGIFSRANLNPVVLIALALVTHAFIPLLPLWGGHPLHKTQELN